MRKLQTFLICLGSAFCFGFGQFNTAPAGLLPVFQMHLSEGSGTKTVDTNGVNNGTLTAATWTNGRIGKGLDFSAANSYVTVTRTNIPTGAQARTIAFWFKMSANPPVWTNVIIFRYGATQETDIYPGGRFGNPQGGAGPGQDSLRISSANWNAYYYNYDGRTQSIMLWNPEHGEQRWSEVRNLTGADTNALEFGGTGAANLSCNCTMDEVQMFNGADNFGKVYQGLKQGIASHTKVN